MKTVVCGIEFSVASTTYSRGDNIFFIPDDFLSEYSHLTRLFSKWFILHNMQSIYNISFFRLVLSIGYVSNGTWVVSMHINNIVFSIQELFDHKIIILNIIRKRTRINLAVAYIHLTKKYKIWWVRWVFHPNSRF